MAPWPGNHDGNSRSRRRAVGYSREARQPATHVRRIADFSALHGVRTGFHGATDLSPVCMGAALHFDAWVPNFGIQEYMQHSAETLAVFPHDYVFRGGRLFCGESAGHGVNIDETLAARYPYSPKQLPIARLEDGTMWDW